MKVDAWVEAMCAALTWASMSAACVSTGCYGELTEHFTLFAGSVDALATDGLLLNEHLSLL